MESIHNNENIKNMTNKESSDKKEIGGNIKNIDKYIGRGGRTGNKEQNKKTWNQRLHGVGGNI